MLKNTLICCLFMLPNIAFSTSGSCSKTPLSHYLLHEDNIIVSFTVTASEFSEPNKNFIDIAISKEFYSHKLPDTRIIIAAENGFGPPLSTFSKNIEWLTVLSKHKNTYIIAGCAPVLSIENGMVQGETGLDVLSQIGAPVSIEILDIALTAFQQGIRSADDVCQSTNSYCTNRTTYDVNTGILNLPSVEYSSFFGSKIYGQVKMQQTSGAIDAFKIIEIK